MSNRLPNHDNIITPALIHWQTDDQGHTVPFSSTFGDVYYSVVDGLAESRYVFAEQNHLPQRFSELFAAITRHRDKPDNLKALASTFTIAELGFGTGLNLLATWQLWRDIKAQYCADSEASDGDSAVLYRRPRLHFISTEKYPLTRADLAKSLASWQQADPKLTSMIKRLLALYPVLISGCHRLHLDNDVTLDLWLGDAAQSLAKLDNSHGAHVDAWFLDGFAPSCNESLWAEQVFTQMRRLSCLNTTVATFSCAGVVKRGLMTAGFDIQKVKGFGRKRQMLTAVMRESNDSFEITQASVDSLQVVVIGSGIAGLMSAWSLANRGIEVRLLDKTAPLAGASGNPRALLAPKMTPIHHVDEHLHSIGYLYSSRFYPDLNQTALLSTAAIFEPTATLDLLTKANIDLAQIKDYPDEMATTLPNDKAKLLTNLSKADLSDNLYLPQSGLINPYALANKVLAHPLIHFEQRDVVKIVANNTQEPFTDADDSPLLSSAIPSSACSSTPTNKHKITLHCQDGSLLTADTIIIATAYHSHLLDDRIFDFRKIRGQLSWFTSTAAQLAGLPRLPLKYNGYCSPFTTHLTDLSMISAGIDSKSNLPCSSTDNVVQFLMGASFVRNDTDTTVRQAEHEINRDKLLAALPELAGVVPADTATWQGRVGIRAQTPDYHPLVGALTHLAIANDSTILNQNSANQNLVNQTQTNNEVSNTDYDAVNTSTHGQSASIWTLSGMGSKGFAFAPICAEALADMMTGSFAPLSIKMLAQLAPQRPRLTKLLTR
ncbi:MAG: FAD-dependent 5-carboxymethylaminomethyl-2-thiouridine(34) oxidoreductase MnmC [Psychrobacter sp.]|nr:FAD-dependent 5-carboxymethylaminomethyl-2-thiouridine(34) oxidoreductase MnmC [Psychrobacter sp.]